VRIDGVDLDAAERLQRGRIIVLPGIEGHSRWNRSIVRGLLDAGVECSLDIHDWTFGRWQSLRSLSVTQRHRVQADEIAAQVAAYRVRQPAAPVWLIGHSGGGAMSVLALERLSESTRADGAILLGPALSPGYDLRPALAHTTRGIWNFSSWGDVIFLVVGTLLFGTLDRRRSISAGASGFRAHRAEDVIDAEESAPAAPSPRLIEVPWRREMLRHGNYAGHFGYVNRRFVRHWIAPIIQTPQATT
jgi:alpha-beta hydrolase superfamily lysophospholipase